MSTSPEKDLHSVYIDGEMPESFIPAYEEAVKNDSKALSELNKMKALHEIFQEDAKAKTTDKAFMDQSFERLQSRLSYTKTINVNKKSYIVPFVKYASSFAAAAAVFALVFIPVHQKAIMDAQTKEVAAIEITQEKNIKPIAENSLVIDDALKSEKLSGGIALTSTKAEAAVNNEVEKSEETASIEEKFIPEQKTVRASALVGGGIPKSFGHRLPSVDPFRPNFSTQGRRISVPKFPEMSNNLNDTQEQQ